jgi:hypothetical protein
LPSLHLRVIAIAAGIFMLAGSLPALGQGLACHAPAQPMQQIELMFGRNIGARLGVNEAAFSRFLAAEVTPRFPDGISVIDATGQWRDKDRMRLVREPSRIVVIVTANDATVYEKVDAIVAIYKKRFHQRSVGVITGMVCAAF